MDGGYTLLIRLAVAGDLVALTGGGEGPLVGVVALAPGLVALAPGHVQGDDKLLVDRRHPTLVDATAPYLHRQRPCT
jgi:hypothetical protein